MNIGAVSCAVMAAVFILPALIFILLKEKCAVLISGFNTLPKEERDKYNTKRMCLDMRNSMLVWIFIFAVGGLLSYLISAYISIAAFAVWLVLFFKDVRLDAESAFKKYLM